MSAEPVVSTSRSPATIAAAVVTFAVGVPYTIAAVDLARIAFGDGEVGGNLRSGMMELGLAPAEFGTILTVSAVAVITTALYIGALGVGILRRREWARYSGILTFLFFGIIMLPLAISGATYDPPSRNAWFGILLALTEFGIVALLMLSAVSDDFETAEWMRKRVERHRELRIRARERAMEPWEDFARSSSRS